MGTGRRTDPKNREEFKLYIKSLLGHPIVEINVTDFQMDQAIDESLKYFQDYSYLGTTHAYYVHEMTQDDLDRRWIMVPEDLIGVTNVYDMNSGSLGYGTNIFTGAWQLNYDMVFGQGSLISNSFLSYYMNRTYFELINQMLVGMKAIRFNQHENKVYIDSSWTSYQVGSKIAIDGYQILDPDEYPDVWSDRWLIKYTAAKVKYQWGQNISKFDATLPGGVKLNYERILSEASEEIRKIEEDQLRDYCGPIGDRVG